jgi:TonB family protein
VKTSDFDARAEQRPTAQAAPRQVRAETPVEILSKPTPAYTEDARAKKIEGEVLLEVEFANNGEVRVLRVVRGLGFGLDEAAMRAVQAMRFKPAQRDGEPIDFRTTVNIVFRLA